MSCDPKFGVSVEPSSCTCDTNPFEIGDVVMLVSGGPAMTVADTCDCGSVLVQWFTDDFLQTADFDADCLLLLSDE